MNGGNPRLPRTKHDLGVHCYKVAIVEDILDQKLLVRKLDMVLNHSLLQRGKAFRKEGVMVLATKVDMPLVRLVDFSCHD